MEKYCWKSCTWHIAQPVWCRCVRRRLPGLLKGAFCCPVKKVKPAFTGSLGQYGSFLGMMKVLRRGTEWSQAGWFCLVSHCLTCHCSLGVFSLFLLSWRFYRTEQKTFMKISSLLIFFNYGVKSCLGSRSSVVTKRQAGNLGSVWELWCGSIIHFHTVEISPPRTSFDSKENVPVACSWMLYLISFFWLTSILEIKLSWNKMSEGYIYELGNHILNK